MADVFRNLDWSVLTGALLAIIPALLCITVHELSHGYVAYRLGDNTAKNAGRLTMNPIRHIDIVGLLAMIFFRFGWAKPVPVNMWKFKSPKKGMAITALAGPASNILLAVVVLFIYGAVEPKLYGRGGIAEIIDQGLLQLAGLSTMLAVFNMLPFPPLDGSKIYFSLLPDRAYYKLMEFERYGMIVLFVLIMTDTLGGFLSTAVESVFSRLYHVKEFSFQLFY